MKWFIGGYQMRRQTTPYIEEILKYILYLDFEGRREAVVFLPQTFKTFFFFY
jgi:hypothetical protein